MTVIDEEPCKGHGTTCKFCKKPITIYVSTSYDALADPNKLIPLAACNTCADLRTERRSIEHKIKTICTLRSRDKKLAQAKEGPHRAALEKLLKQYAHLIARWYGMSGMCWDDAAVDDIMYQPEAWHKNLQTLWKMFAENNKART